MILDLSYNTDFAQVEGDQEEVKPDAIFAILSRKARIFPRGIQSL